MLYMICLTKKRYLIMLSFSVKFGILMIHLMNMQTMPIFLQTLKTLCQITLISRLKWLKLKLQAHDKHFYATLSRFSVKTSFVTRLTRRMPLDATRCLPFRFILGLQWGSYYSIFSFICMFFRSLFVLLSFFIQPLCCLSFDLRVLITPLVYSNSS